MAGEGGSSDRMRVQQAGEGVDGVMIDLVRFEYVGRSCYTM